MPQPLGEWLTNEYGADLSAVTEISGVPNDVTGKFLFPRTLKSLYLPTIFELQTAEAVNENIRISDACADTCTLFCADFSGLSALVNLTTLNLRETKIREFPDAIRPKSRRCT